MRASEAVRIAVPSSLCSSCRMDRTSVGSAVLERDLGSSVTVGGRDTSWGISMWDLAREGSWKGMTTNLIIAESKVRKGYILRYNKHLCYNGSKNLQKIKYFEKPGSTISPCPQLSVCPARHSLRHRSKTPTREYTRNRRGRMSTLERHTLRWRCRTHWTLLWSDLTAERMRGWLEV